MRTITIALAALLLNTGISGAAFADAGMAAIPCSIALPKRAASKLRSVIQTKPSTIPSANLVKSQSWRYRYRVLTLQRGSGMV